MDDLTQKLQSLLSDPESMRNLSELAGMLRQQDTEQDVPPDTAAAAGPAQDSTAVPPFDLEKMLAVGQALSAAQADETAELIRALKPHLSEKRARRAENAVRMLRLWSAAAILRENGILGDFFGGDAP